MATADDLFAEIVANRPDPTWNWDKLGAGAGPWLFALSDGFVDMWNAGMTSAGVPPWISPAPLYPHTHTVATLTAATMTAKLTALGYTGPQTGSFFSSMSTAISGYLETNSILTPSLDGIMPHNHTLGGTVPAFSTFGSASALKSTILGAVPVSGWGVDPLATALSSGIMDFLIANAGLTTESGTSHTHTLTV